MTEEQLAELIAWLGQEEVRLKDEAHYHFQRGDFLAGDAIGEQCRGEAFMCNRVLEKIEELTK